MTKKPVYGRVLDPDEYLQMRLKSHQQAAHRADLIRKLGKALLFFGAIGVGVFIGTMMM